MTLLAKVFLIITVILLCVALYICWLNRADIALHARVFSALLVGVAVATAASVFSSKSEKQADSALHEKIFSALLVGGAAAAAAGVFSLKAERQETSFTSVFVYNAKTRMPLNSYRDNRVNPLANCPNASFAAALLDQVDTERKTKNDGRDIQPEINIYYELLTTILIHNLFVLYSSGWDIEVTSFESKLLGRSTKIHAKPSPDATTVSHQDFVSLFDQPKYFNALPALFNKMTLPPRTQMQLQKDPFGRTIVLKNPFVTVRITITPGLLPPGLVSLSKWVKIPEKEQEEYCSEIFKVKVTAEYAYLRNGNPEMPTYKNWVNQMTEYLRSELSCSAWEERLKLHARDYMLEEN